MKRLITWIVFVAIAALFLIPMSCEKNSPFESIEPVPEVTSSSSTTGDIEILKLNTEQQSFNKLKLVEKLIKKFTGGTLQLTHGIPGGSSEAIYGVSASWPYNVYRIDPTNISSPEVVGQLQFKSRAIAVHPDNGRIYYLSDYPIYNQYKVAYYDPSTNTNTVLSHGTWIKPAYKLAFGPDGTLYAVDRYNSDNLYTIDTATGEWEFYKHLNRRLDDYGDMAFGPDGKFYNVAYYRYSNKLQEIDLNSGDVSTVCHINLYYGKVTGLAFASDGTAYISTYDWGNVFSLNLSNGNTHYVGKTYISYLYDLASPYFEVELAYADVSLEILPNSISADEEIEFSLETTQLAGGVELTFQPHGTIFNPPAILNIVAKGVDLSGVDPNAVNIYYVNQTTGEWEPMVRDDIIVNVHAGTIKVVNARLPHFSRYAIGMTR